MKRMGFILLIIVLFFCTFFISCSTFLNKKVIKGEKMNLSETNMQKIIQVKKEYALGKYIRLEVLEGDQKKK